MDQRNNKFMTRRLLNLPVTDGHGKVTAPDILIDENDKVFFIAKAAIDCDGSGGNPDHDPYWQPDTTYHHEGKALDAYIVPFIVVPPSIAKAVKPIVLGCLARMTYLKTGQSAICIVGDIGPTRKLGECSPRAAKLAGINPSPISGGEDDYNMVLYEIWPGQQATIDGVTYKLQALP